MPDDWSALSYQQLVALMHLSFAMPVHSGYLNKRLKVRGPTLRALEKAGLARCTYYFEEFGSTIAVPFFTLTQRGQRVRNDYIRWHKRLKAKIGSLPPPMQKVLDLA